MSAVTITVPASTANLGPGFGILGLAVDRFHTITAEPRDDGNLVVERRDGSTADNQLDPRHDPVLRGFRAGIELQKIKIGKGYTLILDGDVPQGRGLGTVTAGFAGGLMLSSALTRKPLGSDEMLREIVALGGDPAHGVASLTGTLASACPLESAPNEFSWAILTHPIDPDWHLVFCLPQVNMSTAQTRRVLPANLAHAVTARTTGRVIGLLRALAEGDPELLRSCVIDEVHVPYRRRLVVGMEGAIRAGHDAGAAGATLSGHGPGVLAFVHEADQVVAVAEAMTQAFATAGVATESLQLRPASRPSGDD